MLLPYKSLNYICSCDKIAFGTNKHLLILILTVRKINIHLNQIRNKKTEIRNFKHFNAENFIYDLQDQRWDLCDGDFSVDKKWET